MNFSVIAHLGGNGGCSEPEAKEERSVPQSLEEVRTGLQASLTWAEGVGRGAEGKAKG